MAYPCEELDETLLGNQNHMPSNRPLVLTVGDDHLPLQLLLGVHLCCDKLAVSQS